MATIDAAASGTFKIGGDLPVHRLGFGAMRITGEGIWGPPSDVDEVKRVLRRLPDLGVDFIDTADSYGPYVSEDLIASELAPYAGGMVVATKGGFTRHGPGVWVTCGRPEYLRQCVVTSLRRLKVQRIDLWQLHRIDTKVSADDQLGTIADMQREGLIRHVGLSEVSVADIKTAERHLKVATVQNRYNVAHREHEDVLKYCEGKKIGFIPWFPLAAGDLAAPGGPVDAVARRLDATPSQIALAWMLRRSPCMLPIPGTSKVAHLEENVAAAAMKLTDGDYRALDLAGHNAWARKSG